MRRTVFVVLWTFVFFVLCVFALGIVVAVNSKGDPAKYDAAAHEANEKWAVPIFFGSLLAAFALSAWGVLPGVRRRPAAATAAAPLSAWGVLPSTSRQPGATTAVPADPDIPRPRPTIVVPVGTPEDPPPELAALGPPLQVYEPGVIASMSGITRLAMFVLGLLLLFAPAAITGAVGDHQIQPSARTVLIIAGVVAGFICMTIAIAPGSPHTYRIYHDILVVSDRKTLRIVPWDQIQAHVPAIPFFKDLTVVTYDGQKVPIKNSVRGYHQLRDTVFIKVRDHLLPWMVNKANSGRMVEFGPLGVSSYALSYKGRTVPWHEVTKLVILYGSGYRHLSIYRTGIFTFIWPWCFLNLNMLPNDLMLLELLKLIAPSRLLVHKQARW